MYCASCGGQVSPGLRFCKSCGSKIESGLSELRITVAKTFSVAVALIGTFGLLGFVILVKSFLENGVRESIMLLVSLIYLGAVFGVCFTLIRNIIAMLKSDSPAGEPVPVLLAQNKARELNEYQEPVGSVVEMTTRSLDEVPLKR